MYRPLVTSSCTCTLAPGPPGPPVDSAAAPLAPLMVRVVQPVGMGVVAPLAIAPVGYEPADVEPSRVPQAATHVPMVLGGAGTRKLTTTQPSGPLPLAWDPARAALSRELLTKELPPPPPPPASLPPPEPPPAPPL